MQARDTRARFRKRVKFLGIEGGLIPLIISGATSLVLLQALQFSGRSGNPALIGLAALPLAGTFGYLMLLVSGRRPHFARDLIFSLINGRAVSPVPPAQRIRHPGTAKSPRCVR
jgi:hypothetical protein